METSLEIGELAGALAKAQGQIKVALKDSLNPHFKSKYADLASVWEAIRAPLSSNGLAVTQWPGECAGNQMSMTTMLLHSSGQWMRETLTIPLSKVDAQGYGSATTFARRYALSAVAGVAPDDDDGNAASNPNGAANDAPPKMESAHSVLINAVRGFVREMEGCGDCDQWCAYRDSKEASDIIAQVKEKLPEWWDTGIGMPEEFIPLRRRIEILEAGFANQIADVARV